MYIFNCFEVIKFCKNRNILLAVEAIMIKKIKPRLNHQLKVLIKNLELHLIFLNSPFLF